MADRPLDTRDALTSDHMSARNQGTEKAICGKRRRRWTAEQKRQIVAESMAPGASVATVARQHGVSGGQVYAWRQQLVLGGAMTAAADAASSSVDIAMTTTAAPRLATAIPAPRENTAAAEVVPPPPVQPDADIMHPGGAAASVNEDRGAEDAATTDRESVAARANRGQADRSGEVPNSGCRRALGGFCQGHVTRRSPVPRKQLLDLVLFDVAGDQAFQHIGEPSERLDAIQLRSCNQRHRDGPPYRPAVIASEQTIFSCKSHRPHAAFDDVGIELDAAIVEEQYQSGPVTQGIAHGSGQRRTAGQSRQRAFRHGGIRVGNQDCCCSQACSASTTGRLRC